MKYLIWIFLVSLIILRYFTTRPVYQNGDRLRVSGVVRSDPVVYDNARYLKMGGVKIYTPLFPEISYGDKVIIEGTVENGKIKKGTIIEVSRGAKIGVNFRKKLIDFYKKTFPEPFAGLIAGITLGSKGTLTPGFWEQVKNTGVAHVVVASGTNVTFVVSFLMAVGAGFLARKRVIPLVVLGVVLYLFVSGFDAPLIRAGVMSTLAFAAQEKGRLASGWRILFLTGFLMLIISPDWIGDIGFWLSFVSTASLMLFERKIAGFFRFVPKFLREGLSTSLAAQVGVSPILFVTFGQFNILSPVINALILWTIPYIMALGFLGGVAGLVFPFLGRIILYLVYPMLWWFIQIVELFGKS